jgi:N-acetylneuraminic acid mutarotase
VSAFFGLRASIRFLTYGAAACTVTGTLLAFFSSESPTKASQKTLTFAERVAYQRAIEDVYWRHRIWPKDSPDSKPSLDAVMSKAQLEKKVANYLRKSQVLEDYWQKPIAPEQLQAEMERMARDTKQPEVLRELFEVLGNDPFVIAECLAKPVLTERLAADLSAHDKGRRIGLLRTPAAGSKFSITTLGKATYALPEIDPCSDDTWTPTSVINVPSARVHHTAVWTGSEMIVWGGADGNNDLNTGGRYTPSTDSWTAASITNAPAARVEHTAVWTGSEMIVWGGFDPIIVLRTGGRYNPSTDSWTATASGPDPRWLHTAVWTGSEMIIWGGNSFGGVLFDGGRYNPSSNSWTATSNTNTPTRRYSHTAVWTGSEMIVWGGGFNTGGRYTPSTDSWTATSMTNAPAALFQNTAVWTGSEMIVWGGIDNGTVTNTGGRYDPSTDSWTATSTTNAATARWFHTAVRTDSEMIVWGGCLGNPCSNFVDTGARYDPGTNSWTATSTTNAPSARAYHTAVWSGSEMIVWGGQDNSGNNLNTGGRYCAKLAAPTPTATATATATATSTSTPTPSPTSTPRVTPTPRVAPTPRSPPTPVPRP